MLFISTSEFQAQSKPSSYVGHAVIVCLLTGIVEAVRGGDASAYAVTEGVNQREVQQMVQIVTTGLIVSSGTDSIKELSGQLVNQSDIHPQITGVVHSREIGGR